MTRTPCPPRAAAGLARRRPGGSLLAAVLLAGSGPLGAQSVESFADASGETIFQAACAACHGPDGRGLDRALVGFEEELPDFTDCAFASREPDADWIAVAHEGGPVRGFSAMMPAFRGALTPDQLQRVMGHVRTLCEDPAWPRGELNLPRALVTEKAYPEDEWVVEAGVALEGVRDAEASFVYERRFGSRSQLEVRIPYGWRETSTDSEPRELRRRNGLGDVALGVKHAVHHDVEAGTIVSLGAEVVLPTGDETTGLGDPGSTLELFTSAGRVLGADAFLQAQAGVEVPTWSGAENEAFLRGVVGRTFTRGEWGRSWTPMLEVLASRDLAGGASTRLDVAPQIQVSLNTRQHVLANLGLLVPATDTGGRSLRLLAYVLLDWFDGGFFEGW